MSAPANAMRSAASSLVTVAALADQAGVTPRQVSLARAGKPINAGAYLALCGAIGIDPVDGSPRPVKIVSANVEWWLLGTALQITRACAGSISAARPRRSASRPRRCAASRPDGR